MAEPLTAKLVAQFPVLDYEQARQQLRTGDIVFCSGTYFFSRAIQWFTKSLWSHVGIIYRDDHLERIFVLESETMIGVRLVPLSKYLRDYHGRSKPYKGYILVGRLSPEPDGENTKKVISFGMDALTRPYDNWEIFRIAMRILFRRGRKVRDRKYICSELVYEAFRKADVQFPFHRNSISPDDIWKDQRLISQFRIM
ncbi:MAG: YiiX/YebB-like N1pC/P60 family cysteine hydrolase [Candidatus Accumulibacter sp.]|uniref:YiiX/YebB-like N1pC/P60 family cysteine hydrolase n=1 Tax=Accumulibacter sp. TaxID=2053492 RepID=UPI0028785003|nr:YiiX/YebB-like N1pC/P60 family cysteine hydrolase [Accumulibacter sp.]MDS4013844.1 YiiX/YebB-like N1pC/P60 family cysteine hydrolase [Accumulibacter sp.]